MIVPPSTFCVRPVRSRSRFGLEWLLSAFLLAVTPIPLHSAGFSWDGYCGGANWFDTCDRIESGVCKRHNNWGRAVECIVANPDFPGASDAVTISSAYSVNLSGATVSIQSLNLGGGLTVFGAHTLGISGGGQVLAGGRLTVGGYFIEGGLQTTGGLSSRIEIDNVGGSSGLHLRTASLQNDGLVQWKAGNVTTENGCLIRNLRRFEIKNAGSMLDTGIIPSTFENDALGEIVKSSAGVTLLGIAFQNAGTVTVEDGDLTLSRGGANSGVITLQAPSVLQFQGGLFSLQLGGAIPGTGQVRLVLGTLSIDGPAAILSFEQTGGVMDGSQVLAIGSSGHWGGGTMQGSGITRVAVDAGLIIDGSATKRLEQRTLDNRGDVQVMGASTVELASAAAVTNQGTFEFLSDGGMSWTLGGGMPTFSNSGLLLKSGGAGTTTIRAAFNNSGTVEVLTGTLYNPGAASYTQTAGTTRLHGTTLHGESDVLIRGGLLTGSGTVRTFKLVNRGVVAPGSSPGTLACTGDFDTDSAGVLRVEIGGPTPGTMFDVITVAGTAFLGGKLEVQMIGGYDPAIGTTFDILTAGSVSGTFDTYGFPSLSGGKTLEARYFSNRVQVAVVAVPFPGATPWVVATMALGLAWVGARLAWHRGRFV